MESQLLEQVIKIQKKILKEIKNIDVKCNQILMGTALDEMNKCTQKLIENMRIIEDVLNVLSPPKVEEPNIEQFQHVFLSENYVEQQSLRDYDPTDFIKELEIFAENHETDHSHKSLGN